MPRNLVILGSTGSIGRQTIQIATEYPDDVTIYGLAADRSVELLKRQAEQFHPVAVSVAAGLLGSALDDIEVLHGQAGMVDLVQRPDVDLVVVATGGGAGLLPTLAALEAGKLVALANKETLVMAGPVIRDVIRGPGSGSLVPIDSEHSAIWQCLQGEAEPEVERLTLTASGGALRHLPLRDLEGVTPAQALNHPTWSMGRKITIDSANLMNKGLETIEARWLFDVPMDRIDVVLHRESIVHSLVTFNDGSVKAQLGIPDMRLPIQYALSHPTRWPSSRNRLDLVKVSQLHFEPVDLARYPALRLATDAGRAGGTYPAVLSAADEIAVNAFLQERVKFTDIPEIVGETLGRHTSCESPELDDILEADRWARAVAGSLVASF